MRPGGSIYIAGPTASGKSSAALILAQELGGEIISVDSMQVYRGMDIGTAKPSAEELLQVKHHLVDVADPSENFDAARFLQMARAAEQDIQQRGKRPIFCGGTGLYFNALSAGIGSAPSPDAEYRTSLEALSTEELLARLRRADPAALEWIDQSNRRRLVRALEVCELTGEPVSKFRADWNAVRSGTAPSTGEPGWFGLRRDRADLTTRINTRVDAMFASGMVEETRSLLGQGLEFNRTAMQAIGYRQVVEHLRGERGLPETIELVKVKTRQYAKRQMTWFRRQLNLQWVDIPADADAGWITTRIRGLISEFQPPATI